jgi:hypothetical protein
MKILITESQYRRLLNKKYLNEQRVEDLGPKKPTNTSGSPSFLQQPNASVLNNIPTTPFLKNQFGGESTTFKEPLGDPKKNVNVNGKIIPAQNDTHYWDGSTWIQKTLQNVDAWRSVPSGFLPTEYGEYLKELEKINKIYSSGKKLSLNSAESTGVKTSPADAKTTAINYLNSIYYDKKFPLGISNAQKKERLSKLEATNKYYDDQIKQVYGDPKINRGDTFGAIHSKQVGDRVKGLEYQKKISIDAINSEYGRWFKKKEEEGFDWITVIGFAMYLCPYTAAFAPFLVAGQGLLKAGIAYEEGDMKMAAFETLFALLPLGTVGKTLKSVNLLNAVDKLVLGKSLEVAEINVLNTLTSKSSIIKTELKAAAESLISQVPESARKEAEAWTKAIIDKAFKEGEKQASGYESLKDNIKKGAKEQKLEPKLV